MKKALIVIVIISLGCAQEKLFIYKGRISECVARIAPMRDTAKNLILRNLCPDFGGLSQHRWKIGDTIAIRRKSNWVYNKSKHK